MHLTALHPVNLTCLVVKGKQGLDGKPPEKCKLFLQALGLRVAQSGHCPEGDAIFQRR